MKVLHFQQGSPYGGIQSMMATLARGRAASPNLEQEFALCFEGRLSEEIRAAGVPLHLLGEVRARYPWQKWLAQVRLRNLIRGGGYDAVILHGSWCLGLFGPTVERSGVPLVYWMHNDTKVRNKNLVERWAAKTHPHLVVANSAFTADSIPLTFETVPPAAILACPVDEPDLGGSRAAVRAQMRAEFGTSADKTVILMVGRPEEWKGHRLLLQAAHQLRDLPNWELWIAGGAVDAEQKAFVASLVEQARSLGLAHRVRWLGQRADVPRVMAAADIFCQPNESPEPFGIVFVEALYAGLPIVSMAHGGVCEIVDEHCAVLVPPGDVSALAQGLRQLVCNPTLLAKMGRCAAPRAVAVASPEVVLPRLNALLKDAVAPQLTALVAMTAAVTILQ